MTISKDIKPTYEFWKLLSSHRIKLMFKWNLFWCLPTPLKVLLLAPVAPMINPTVKTGVALTKVTCNVFKAVGTPLWTYSVWIYGKCSKIGGVINSTIPRGPTPPTGELFSHPIDVPVVGGGIGSFLSDLLSQEVLKKIYVGTSTLWVIFMLYKAAFRKDTKFFPNAETLKKLEKFSRLPLDIAFSFAPYLACGYLAFQFVKYVLKYQHELILERSRLHASKSLPSVKTDSNDEKNGQDSSQKRTSS